MLGKGSFEPRKYREPDYDKKLLLAVCQPQKIMDTRPQWDRCSKLNMVTEKFIHPYEKLLANDLIDDLETSRMAIFLHRNTLNTDDHITYKNILFKNDFLFRIYNNSTAHYAFKGTKYEHLIPLHVSGNALIIEKPGRESNELRISQLLGLLRKMHSLIPMYGIVDGNIVSKDDLQFLAQNSAQQLHYQLSSIIAASSAKVASNISHHLSRLSNNLSQYIKQKEEENT